MRSRKPHRPQRTPLYVGCEGQSEVSYSGWLRNLARDRAMPVHLYLDDLGLGAGDPLARVEMAIDHITRIEQSRAQFAHRFLLLDTDQLQLNKQRAADAHRIAASQRISIIWQRPTHEAFLLRHIPGCHTLQPPDKITSNKALLKQWGDYVKPMTSDQIERRLGIQDATRAATDLPELDRLLKAIGLSV